MCMQGEGGRAHASHVQNVGRLHALLAQSPGFPALSPAAVLPSGQKGALARAQMPPQAVPIPAGDVMPRGRRAPQKPLVLAPKLGLGLLAN